MTKKHFIALADRFRLPGHVLAAIERAEPRLKRHEALAILYSVAEELSDFCQSQNPRFDRERWLAYVRGENGPNGGKKQNNKSADAFARFAQIGKALTNIR